MSVVVPLVALAIATAGIRPAAAGLFDSTPGFTPRVPISALAPSWFDPSRLHVSSMVSVGSGGFGNGLDALQVTSLSYRFAGPLSMSVGLGNAWGATAPGNRSSFFLESFNLQYRPNPSMQFQVQFRDLRSALQLQNGASNWGW